MRNSACAGGAVASGPRCILWSGSDTSGGRWLTAGELSPMRPPVAPSASLNVRRSMTPAKPTLTHLSEDAPEDAPGNRHLARLALAIYIGLAVYGSLFPFSPWHWPAGGIFSWLTTPQQHISRADLLVNLLAYVPMGVLAAFS